MTPGITPGEPLAPASEARPAPGESQGELHIPHGQLQTPPGEPLLAAAGVSVSFPVGSKLMARIRHEEGVLHAVDGVDMDIRRGESLALVGESGSGKSTLALALTGVRPVDRGEIRFDGRRLPSHRSRADRRRIQMVFQDPYSSLNPRLTVGGMLAELLKAHHVVPRSQVKEVSAELLTLVGLAPTALSAYPRQFSGGQRQRVAIARALALRPDVLVADEPVSALDVSVQATILNLLQDLRRELGLTLLLISHNLAVVRHLCDRVAVMYLGRIVEIAPTEQVFRAPRHPYTRGLLAAIPRLTAHATEDGPPAIAGDPPSPLRIPAGCRFRTRCPMAQARCEQEDPALAVSPDDPQHLAACHFAFTPATPATSATPGTPATPATAPEATRP
jgi:oligopeptide transport system ATP-binding protein